MLPVFILGMFLNQVNDQPIVPEAALTKLSSLGIC